MIRSYLPGLAAVVAIGVGACQPAATVVPPLDVPAQQPVLATADSVRLWIEAPAEVRRGEPLPITLRVRNLLTRPVTLEHGGRPLTFDLIVTRPDGTQVWSRMHGRGVLNIQWSTTLQPGETLEFTESWDQRANNGTPVAPGTYSVRGALVAVPGNPTTEPRPLLIRP